jgi:hypothetical protein
LFERGEQFFGLPGIAARCSLPIDECALAINGPATSEDVSLSLCVTLCPCAVLKSHDLRSSVAV